MGVMDWTDGWGMAGFLLAVLVAAAGFLWFLLVRFWRELWREEDAHIELL